jgi:hypothetical protein
MHRRDGSCADAPGTIDVQHLSWWVEKYRFDERVVTESVRGGVRARYGVAVENGFNLRISNFSRFNFYLNCKTLYELCYLQREVNCMNLARRKVGRFVNKGRP